MSQSSGNFQLRWVQSTLISVQVCLLQDSMGLLKLFIYLYHLKMLLLEKAEALQEEAAELMES